MAMQGIVSEVGASTFWRVETKSSGTSTRAANFNGQRNTLSCLNLWQNCSRRSSAYYATVLWAQWGRWVPHRFRSSAVVGAVSGGPKCLQYQRSMLVLMDLIQFCSILRDFGATSLIIGEGGDDDDDVDRYLRHCANSTCCTTIMRTTLQ